MNMCDNTSPINSNILFGHHDFSDGTGKSFNPYVMRWNLISKNLIQPAWSTYTLLGYVLWRILKLLNLNTSQLYNINYWLPIKINLIINLYVINVRKIDYMLQMVSLEIDRLSMLGGWTTGIG
jgi:hypothetical protein